MYYKLIYKEGWEVILKSDKFPFGDGLQIRDDGELKYHKDGHFHAHASVKEPNQEEISWLEASILARKAIKLSNYEIY